MESLGQKLREAREKHNYSLEQVARDTHISKQYLEALEEESFASIPGDTYVIGFLRNYAEYLSLNPEELVALYRNIRIQEQPLPMNELLEGSKARSPSRTLLIVIAAIALVAVGVFLLVRFVLARPQPAAEAGQPRPASSSQAEYTLQEEAITRWFNQDDTVDVPLDSQQYRLKLITIGDSLTLKVPGGTAEISIGQNRQLDLNGDARNDIRLQLNDLDVTATARRANLSIYKLTKGAAEEVAVLPQKSSQTQSEASAEVAKPAEVTRPAEGTPTTEVAKPAETPTGSSQTGQSQAPAVAASSSQDITTAESTSPFRVSISFRGYCLLRYLVDGDTRDERFFHKGENFSLDAKNEVRLWISNAGALRVSVAGREIEMGRAGEVVTRTIRWSQSRDSGGYRLQVVPSD